MRAYQRKQLKQDSFTATAKETVSWAVEHRQKLIYGAIIVAVVLCIYLGYWYATTYRDDEASADLGAAIATYNAPIRGEGEPVVPGVENYGSAKERAGKAQQEFQAVVSRYGHTRSGKMARYFLGVTDAQLGDNAAAESNLKAAADSAPKDTASLAKFALAALYRQTNRTDQAIALYKDLIDHPTDVVSKSTAQLELASLYEQKQPAEAKKIYQELQKNPNSPAAQIATSKLAELK